MGCITCKNLGCCDPITDEQYKIKIFWCCKKNNKLVNDIFKFPTWCPTNERDVIKIDD